MKRIGRKTAAVAGVLAIGGGVTGGAAIASGGDDDATQKPITGSAIDRAKEAALAHTGEGRVTATEVGDEESYYEVEVTLDNGKQVDVQLNRSFEVVSSENDGHDDNEQNED
jgi:uncharacterized membrane protein YkoI